MVMSCLYACEIQYGSCTCVMLVFIVLVVALDSSWRDRKVVLETARDR